MIAEGSTGVDAPTADEMLEELRALAAAPDPETPAERRALARRERQLLGDAANLWDDAGQGGPGEPVRFLSTAQLARLGHCTVHGPAVLGYLLERAGPDGLCRRTVDEIRRDLGLWRSQVQVAIQSLQQAGIVDRMTQRPKPLILRIVRGT